MLILRKVLWWLVQIGLMVYILLAAGLYFFQEKLLFHPAPFPEGFQFHLSLPFEERTLEVDKESIHSLIVRAPASPGLILMFHGNADTLAEWSPTAEELAQRLGWDVWLMDYPGFGKSTGKIRSEAQLHFIARAFLDAAQKEAGARPVVIYGRSIGTGLAAKLAAENPVAGLVLESAYLSIRSIVSRQYSWAPIYLLRYPLRSDQWVPLVKCPSLFLHGDEDEIIPFASGFALAELAKRGHLAAIKGGHHNDLHGFESYWAEYGKFLQGIAAASKTGAAI